MAVYASEKYTTKRNLEKQLFIASLYKVKMYVVGRTLKYILSDIPYPHKYNATLD